MAHANSRPNDRLTVVVVLDAFRSDYLELDQTCFLSRLCSGSTVIELLPTFAFEPDLAYLTGLLPEETDSGTHFWFSPDTSPFRYLRKCGKYLDRLDSRSQSALRKLMRIRTKWSRFPGLRSGGFTAGVPFQFLSHFDYRHYWDMDDPQYSASNTIFDELRSRGRRWAYYGYPKTTSGAVDVAKAVYESGFDGADLVFLMISDLDHVGHASGPESSELRQVFERLNVTLAELFDHFSSRVNNLEFLVFGDHGMNQVHKLIDIEGTLRTLRSTPGEDYVYFLDSTLARFWFSNEDARKEVESALREVDGGSLLDERDRAEYNIRYRHNKFGDLIFWADGGSLVFPNFFQNRVPDIGMHGYRNEVVGNHSVLIHWSSKGRPEAAESAPQSISVVHRHLCEALELPR